MNDIYLYIIGNIYQFLGVFFSIIYVWLSIRENVFCWVALIIASIFNMIAYNLINLPLQVFMQLFFIGTGLYGWYNWRRKQNGQSLVIQNLGFKRSIYYLFIGLIMTLILTAILKNLEISNYPFLDSLMFSFNIIPMYMMGKKIIESWIFFIAIDIISGIFFLLTTEYFFTALFFCYIGFATYGYISWKKQLK